MSDRSVACFQINKDHLRVRIDHLQLRRVSRGEGDLAAGDWSAALRDSLTYERAIVLKSEFAPGAGVSGGIAQGLGWVGRAEIQRAAGAGPERERRAVVIKVRPLHTRSARLKVRLGFGRAERHWRAAAILAMNRIPTARPYCLAIVRIDGVLCEVLAMQALEGPTLLECIARSSAGHGDPIGVCAQHRLAEAAARLTGDVHGARLFNRDHKPSNIIVTALSRERATLAMIDCVGIRRDWRPGDDLRCQEMLAKQLIEPLGCGVPVRRALQMRALRTLWEGAEPCTKELRREVEREFVDKVHSLVQAHGDPRPKLNPLRETAKVSEAGD